MVWDSAGRRYLDFANRGGAVILGHADPDVERAAAGRAHGFDEVAARIAWLVPCAEAVALAASGTAAMLAALRMARAHTGRERVLACATRPVPGARAGFLPGDLDALAALLDLYADEVAAVVVEPLAAPHPAPGAWLARVRDLACRHGAVLVFDETRSGFRVHKGGGQTLLGVTPDLAVFGPSLGNGAAVGAVAGRQPLIDAAPHRGPRVAPEAIAAAAATLRKLEREPVIATLRIRGAEVQAEVEALLASTGADAFVSIAGDPCWSVLDFSGAHGGSVRSLFLAESHAHGLHSAGAHVMSYAHGDEAISALIGIYAKVLPRLVEAFKARGRA